ncbi:DUF5677 domain-containing protein [Pimelobacter simplex]|uniref:DUF5677 domain-containing protein n=1 Tax=Nocardioides simplex TaxID=2045 RepID=UPI00366CF35B
MAKGRSQREQPDLTDLGGEAKAIVSRWIRGVASASRGGGADVGDYVSQHEWEIQVAGLNLGELRLEGLARLRVRNGEWHDLEQRHLHGLIALSIKLGSLCATRWRPNRRRGNTIDALLELHGQAVQVADEVAALLCDGRPVGALARWRTLYELSIVMRFLAGASDAAARCYKASLVAEQWRYLAEFEAYLDETDDSWGIAERQRAQIDPLRRRLRPAYERAVRTYGRSVRDSYGWAQEDLDQRRVTFKNLVEAVDGVGEPEWMDYQSATQHVHALRSSSVLTQGRSWRSQGPLFAPLPQVPQRVYVLSARTLRSANDVLAGALHGVAPELPQIAYFAEVCSMMALDVETEAFRGGASLHAGYLDAALGLL